MSDLNYLELVKEQIALLFETSVKSIAECGEGFYAKVFTAEIDSSPGIVIAKAYKFPDIGAREGKQLSFLAEHAQTKIPEVYSFHPADENCPLDILFMEHINGVTAADITFPDEKTKKVFLNEVVDNLKGWHAVSNPAGFGSLEGPFYEKWSDYYGEKVRLWHKTLKSMPARKVFSDYVMSVVDFSMEHVDKVFENSAEKSSLLHSDYNLWNIMIDPDCYKLAGVIDPSDACWGDPEMDLFHLPNCRPELKLLDVYLEGHEPDDEFWMRHCFYRFWDDIKHFLRVEWYEEKRFRSYAEELERRIKAYLNIGSKVSLHDK